MNIKQLFLHIQISEDLSSELGVTCNNISQRFQNYFKRQMRKNSLSCLFVCFLLGTCIYKRLGKHRYEWKLTMSVTFWESHSSFKTQSFQIFTIIHLSYLTQDRVTHFWAVLPKFSLVKRIQAQMQTCIQHSRAFVLIPVVASTQQKYLLLLLLV